MKLRTCIWGCGLACALALSNSASAIVSVEDLHLSEAEPGLNGKFQFSLSGESGNADKLATGVASRVQWNRGSRNTFLILNYDYGESFDRKDTDKSFVHLRHIRPYAPRRAWEAFAQWQHNEFARLNYRALLGGGLRLALLERGADRALFFGIGGFFAKESLEAQEGTNDQGGSDWWGNTYLLYKRKLNAQVEFQTTTYFQPKLSDSKDFRLLEDMFLRVRMSDTLALKLILNVAHDSQPPQAVEKTDTSYATSLEYVF